MVSFGSFRRLLVGLLVASLIAAACGSSDGDVTSSTEGDNPSGADAEDDLEVLKIGFAFPDLEAFALLNDEFSIGDPEQQANAVLAVWRQEGLLPDGIDIEIIPAKYSITNDDAKVALCSRFAQDDEVFAVLSGIVFTAGAECLAGRFDIPVVDADGATPPVYERNAPYFFTLGPDRGTQLRNYVAWADENGYLEGKRLGVYFENRLDDAMPAFRDELEQRGITIESEVSTSGIGIGGAEDTLSTQRFIEDDVDVVMPLVGGTSVANMLGEAKNQGFEALYLPLDYAEQTTDAAPKPWAQQQFDGSFGQTYTAVGELAGGQRNAQATECLANYVEFTGEEIRSEAPENAEYSSILRSCDLMTVLLAGLQAMDGDISQEAFVSGLEQAGELQLAGSLAGSFSETDHSLVDQYRTIQWDSTCLCWNIAGDLTAVTR